MADECEGRKRTICKGVKICCDTFLNCLLNLLLSVVYVLSLCSTQISMFHLSMKLGSLVNVSKSSNTTNSTFISSERVETTRIFLIVVMAITTPYLFNFLRAVLKIWGLKDLEQKKKDKIKCPRAVFAAAAESAGVSILAISVFPIHSGVVCSLLISCISVGIVGHSAGIVYYGWKDKKSCVFLLALSSSLIHIAATVCILIWVSMVTNPDYRYERPLLVSAAIILLSFAWSPLIQKYSVKIHSNESPLTENKPGTSSREEAGTFTQGDNQIRFNQDPMTIESGNSFVIEPDFQANITLWKMAIWSNFLKAVLVVTISFLLFYNEKKLRSRTTTFYIPWEEFRLAWKLTWDSDVQIYVLLSVSCVVAYGSGLLLCSISKSMILFLIPGYAANAFILLSMWNPTLCETVLPFTHVCGLTMDPLWAVGTSTGCLALAAVFTLLVFGCRTQNFLLCSESQIVWLPTFNSVAPAAWSILNKRMWPWNEEQNIPLEPEEKAQIFICTTMYRETRKEMEQLLLSFKELNSSFCESSEENHNNSCRYEFHIVFDNGVKGTEPTEFALQFLFLIDRVAFGISIEQFTKIGQPYGLMLRWTPQENSSFKYPLSIHLKNNEKVKKKKRWSQVMYMEYLINHKEARGADQYILTTDGDMKFKRKAIDVLVDLMSRDKTVGAVTGRTHPDGSGPCVWYQIFEYAIGHWLQKTAEDTVGSVLCAPGCFSLLRLQALKQVIEEYSTDVTCASDFLTKDMGEDRWLCTLLIQNGWRIRYYPVSENKTYCPNTFEEFYKQRRRWTLSIFANMMLLMKDYKKLKQLPAVFLIYLGIILFFTLFGPSTVIMFVAGGLQMAWNISPYLTIVAQTIACLVYGVVCLNINGKHHISIALGLTLVYSVLMTAVAVGTVLSIVNEAVNSHERSGLDTYMPESSSTIYIIVLVGMFILTGILHGEMLCLFYGVMYFLGIPSGNLILIIYSLCNITDRSWGTREEKDSCLEETYLLSILKTKLTDRKQWICNQLRECCCKTQRETCHQSVHEAKIVPTDETDVINVDTWFSMEFHHKLPIEKDAKQWLESIGLGTYMIGEKLQSRDIYESDKSIEDVVRILQVSKKGHIDRLNYALNRVRHPNKDEVAQQKLMDLLSATTDDPEDTVEETFWRNLIERCLDPKSESNTSDKDLKSELVKLRNRWLQWMLVSNIIGLIVILASYGELAVLGINAIGLTILVIYMFLLSFQFLVMLAHRGHTMIHKLTRKRSCPKECDPCRNRCCLPECWCCVCCSSEDITNAEEIIVSHSTVHLDIQAAKVHNELTAPARQRACEGIKPSTSHKSIQMTRVHNESTPLAGQGTYGSIIPSTSHQSIQRPSSKQVKVYSESTPPAEQKTNEGITLSTSHQSIQITKDYNESAPLVGQGGYGSIKQSSTHQSIQMAKVYNESTPQAEQEAFEGITLSTSHQSIQMTKVHNESTPLLERRP